MDDMCLARSLEELDANFNKLDKLPDTIGFELSNVRKLSVNSNKLVFLPHSLTHMTSLRVLDVRLNCLRSLPEDLENLINLEVLNVSQNFQYLQRLPYSIGLLLSLVELDASYNNISALPDSVGCLRKLKKLCVEGNPLSSPPPEVLEQGLHAVREYMSERMNSGASHKSSPSTAKKWWAGKLLKYGTFNGHSRSAVPRDQEGRYSFNKPETYHSISGLASPRHLGGIFSPGRRLFSPLTYFSK